MWLMKLFSCLLITTMFLPYIISLSNLWTYPNIKREGENTINFLNNNELRKWNFLNVNIHVLNL